MSGTLRGLPALPAVFGTSNPRGFTLSGQIRAGAGLTFRSDRTSDVQCTRTLMGGQAMRTDDRKSRLSLKGAALKGAAGVALVMSCAAGIAAMMSVPGGGPFTTVALARMLPVAARGGGTEAAAGAGQSAEARGIDRIADHTSSAATSPGTQANGSAGTEDAEIAVLLDWHLAANNVYGAIHLEDLQQTQ